MSDIVIFGSGMVAQVARVYIERHGPDRIVGFTVDAAYKEGDTFDGYPLVAWEELEKHFPPGEVKLLGPMTFKQLNTVRRDRYHEGLQRGYEFTSFIHPDSHVYTEDIGENCFILEKNTIQPFVTIGNNVMIWSGCHIGHHASIGDGCFIATGTAVGGAATIGKECHISGHAGIVQNLKIGDRCAILNRALVTQDLPDDSVIVGASGTIKRYTSARIKNIL